MITRDEILTKLYAIRAGLSAISVRKDDIAKDENRVYQINQNIAQEKINLSRNQEARLEQIRKCEKELENCQDTLDYEKKRLEDSKKDRKKSSSKLLSKGIARDGKGSFILFGILFFVGLFWVISSVIVFLVITPALAPETEAVEAGILPLFMALPFVVLSIVFGIKFLSRILRARRFVKYVKKEAVKENEENINKYEKDLSDLQAELKRLQDRMHTEEPKEKSLFAAQKEQQMVRISEINANKNATALYAKNIYDVLVNEYGTFLAVSDWKDLDYIIYLFATGRADSIKESLHLLDEMKRHELLIQALGHISSTIRQGFGELNANMNRCFSTMSNQIQSLSGQIDSIQSLQREQNQALGKLSEQVNFQSALNQKTNDSCESMMKDVSFICERCRGIKQK